MPEIYQQWHADHVYDAENRLVQVTKVPMVLASPPTTATGLEHRLLAAVGRLRATAGRHHGVCAMATVSLCGTTPWEATRRPRNTYGRDSPGGMRAATAPEDCSWWVNGIGYLRTMTDAETSGLQRRLQPKPERLRRGGILSSGLPASMPIGLLTYAHGTKEYFSDLGLYNYGRRF
ncbi:MAG: hypothetical protein HS122_14075 [Opitutaceae bacterium]|nr:hypothetical protein [Opitutaceae bacterium]